MDDYDEREAREPEVRAQNIVFLDVEGGVRPLDTAENVPPVEAVQYTSQVDQDHLLALQWSREEQERPSAQAERRTPDFDAVSYNQRNYHNITPDAIVSTPEGGTHASDDWTLARTLQMLEFEMSNEMMVGADGAAVYADGEDETEYIDGVRGDFNEKEYRASSLKRQAATVSMFICIVQVVLLAAMMIRDGIAPSSENPMIGPPAVTLVRFGAKEAALMIYKDQWWRLISAIMLHGGIWHILSNVLIQMRVGGYLNILFGTPQWLWIYFYSGAFGYMCSCIFFPESISVGSSGSLMGMLSAWCVYIVFRWRKIPRRFRSRRNCQLGVVVVAIALTLGLSFAPYVDWSAHFAGAFQVGDNP